MPQDFETPTSPASYQPIPAVVVSDDTDPYRTGAEPADSGSTTDVAKDQAAAVGNTAADASKQVAGVAKDQAANVASEAAAQTRNLVDQTRSELQDQASQQQQRLASGVRSLSDQLSSMAQQSEQSGPASDLVKQAATRASDFASWLEQRDPGALLDEIRSFARRRPGAFLAIAAGAGLAAGRLTRGTVDASRNQNESGSRTGVGQMSSSAPLATYPESSYADRPYAETGYPDAGYTGTSSPSGTYGETAYPATPATSPYPDPVIEEQNQSGGRL